MSVGLIILAAMAAPWLHAEAERHLARRRQRDWDAHVEQAVALTDCPVFDATIRAMPLNESTLAVQGLLLDGDPSVVGDEAERWLAGGAS